MVGIVMGFAIWIICGIIYCYLSEKYDKAIRYLNGQNPNKIDFGNLNR
jgi:uncharacterized membrane protein YcaP (DUF421 family)